MGLDLLCGRLNSNLNIFVNEKINVRTDLILFEYNMVNSAIFKRRAENHPTIQRQVAMDGG